MPPSVLQDVLTEGDTGQPFFSDRDGSEEPSPGLLALVEQAIRSGNTVRTDADHVEALRLKVVRAEMLGHRTLPLDTIRSVFNWD